MISSLKKSPAHHGGMTLVESLVVVLTMILVIAVLFSGTRSWKRNSDRTACINNIQEVQHMVRAFQNLHGLPVRAPINIQDDLIGPQLAMASEPYCPGYGSYSYTETIPPLGELAISCSLSAGEAHKPETHLDW